MCGLFSSFGSGGFSLGAMRARASHCGGFSCCGTRALGARASVVAAHGLISCGALVQLTCILWNLSGTGIKPATSALTGRFPTTGLPGASKNFFFFTTEATSSACAQVGEQEGALLKCLSFLFTPPGAGSVTAVSTSCRCFRSQGGGTSDKGLMPMCGGVMLRGVGSCLYF